MSAIWHFVVAKVFYSLYQNKIPANCRPYFVNVNDVIVSS